MPFSVGYQLLGGEPDYFCDIVRDHADTIGEVYFAWPGESSGRAPVADEATEQIQWELEQISALGVKLNLLLNASCYGEEALAVSFEQRVLQLIGGMKDAVGLQVVTTMSPMVARAVKQRFPDVDVRASVNMRLGTVKALQYVAHLFDSYCVQREYNRDIERMVRLSEWARSNGKRLHVLANSGCLNYCSVQTFHDNVVAHETTIHQRETVANEMTLCREVYGVRDRWPNFLQGSWIRPEDIAKHRKIIDCDYKLATRMHDNPRLVVGAYSAGTFYGNLLDLTEPGFGTAFHPYTIDNRRFPANWFERTTQCDKRCDTCTICREVLDHVVVKVGQAIDHVIVRSGDIRYYQLWVSRNRKRSSDMTNKERALAVLRYQPYDRMPVVHFGYWGETLQKWVHEGHLRQEEIDGWRDGNSVDIALNTRIGFDFDWHCVLGGNSGLLPAMDPKVIEEFPDGTQHIRGADGVTYVHKPGTGSIPAHVDYLLKDRAAWEEHYKWRYQWDDTRVNRAGLDELRAGSARENPLGLHCGSLYGAIRTVMTMEGACYLMADDEELFNEIIDTVADLCYRNVKALLESGVSFDFAHFWEDICFKNGPLITPSVFEMRMGPHYQRITDLTRAHGLDLCSLDCDGKIDALVPTWISNGVNTMFPIEVGTWNASIKPWRTRYGKDLRGVGGMNKTVFARDRTAVDAEIERLKPLVALGGFIPCPDHRIAPDALWDNVRYYCDRMQQVFG